MVTPSTPNPRRAVALLLVAAGCGGAPNPSGQRFQFSPTDAKAAISAGGKLVQDYGAFQIVEASQRDSSGEHAARGSGSLHPLMTAGAEWTEHHLSDLSP
jgi:hypothetical protein